MNRGLLLKAIRETWPALLFFGLAMLAVEAILASVVPALERQAPALLTDLPFVRAIVSATIGVDAAGTMGPELFQSIPWVHPAVLALVWACAIVCCTRVPAGEVDRGTIDILLGLPVSRTQVFLCESLACFAGFAAVLALGWLGNVLGGLAVAPQFRADRGRMLIVGAHLLLLVLAVGGVACLISSLSDRRGRAIAIAFALVLASFLLNYLAQFWEPARRLSWLSVLRYYRPLYVLRDGTIMLRDMAVLGAAAASCWLAAGWIFARRDLSTL